MSESAIITKWSASRSGASITIKGENPQTGEAVKVSGVCAIRVMSSGRVEAVTARGEHMTGRRYILDTSGFAMDLTELEAR